MTEWDIIERLHRTRDLFSPLQLESLSAPLEEGEAGDAFLTTFLEADNPTEFFYFLVEIKSRSNPQIVHQAISEIKKSTNVWRQKKVDHNVYPLIIVPYLSEERLEELYREQVSGVDLCGNGVVTIPEKQLLIFRTGKVNLYPESRPVSNPFQGKSSLVARVFFREPAILASDRPEHPRKFDTLIELHREIESGGVSISLSQVSKAVAALKEKRLIEAAGRSIYALDHDEMMRRLAVYWAAPTGRRKYFRLENGLETLATLDQAENLDWAISGSSSVRHYGALAESGRMQVMVSNLRMASEFISGEAETVPNFADIEMIESDDPAFYFDNDKDESGIRWASRLQAWIELSNGDARQQDAARIIYHQIFP